MRRPRGFGYVYRRPNRPDGHLWIRWYHDGDRCESVAKALGKAHVTEKDAERLLNARLKDKIEGHPIPVKRNVTIAELMDDYGVALRVRGVKNLRQTRNHIEVVKRWFGRERAGQLTTGRLQRLVDEILSREYVRAGARRSYARGTVKTRLYVLRAALAHARDVRGKIAVIPKLPRMIVRNARQGFFSYEQFRAIHGHLDQPAADIALFGYLTGWRQGEILDLPLTALDLKGETVRLYDSKTGEGRVRPIVEPDLRELLERRVLARVLGCPFVFHHQGRQVSRTWFAQRWGPARMAAGLPWALFHDFRRTAYNDFVSGAGLDLVTAMELTGHKSLSMAKRYNIVEQRRMRVGLAKVAALRAEQKAVDTLASGLELAAGKSRASGQVIPLGSS
jgi:integrase